MSNNSKYYKLVINLFAGITCHLIRTGCQDGKYTLAKRFCGYYFLNYHSVYCQIDSEDEYWLDININCCRVYKCNILIINILSINT